MRPRENPYHNSKLSRRLRHREVTNAVRKSWVGSSSLALSNIATILSRLFIIIHFVIAIVICKTLYIVSNTIGIHRGASINQTWVTIALNCQIFIHIINPSIQYGEQESRNPNKKSTNNEDAIVEICASMNDLGRLRKTTSFTSSSVNRRLKFWPWTSLWWNMGGTKARELTSQVKFDRWSNTHEQVVSINTLTIIIGVSDSLKCKFLFSTFRDATLRWYMSVESILEYF